MVWRHLARLLDLLVQHLVGGGGHGAGHPEAEAEERERDLRRRRHAHPEDNGAQRCGKRGGGDEVVGRTFAGLDFGDVECTIK